ncbi:programmed cell death protein 2 [Tricladium varicosporioides]|nr:programmed cell death protein 2 [Hymenoscyphus varicosporioides]
MAPYDSDSDEGEDNDYTETNVLLGYAAKEPTDDTISQLGGKPTWLNPTTPPSATLAKCKVCNDLMVLLLQLNGDLPEIFPGHERRLYVLTCRRKTCRRKEGSVRALRGTTITEVVPSKERKENKTAKPEPAAPRLGTNIGEMLFGAKPSSNANANANPFSSSGSANLNPFSTSQNPSTTNSTTTPNAAPSLPSPPTSNDTTTESLPRTFASALTFNAPKKSFGPPPPPEPWPADSVLPPSYPLFYLVDADYETLDKVEEVPIPTQTMDLDEPSGSSGGKEDKDVYESSIDKTFQRFADRLAQNPEQVLRYEFKGSPLLYSKSDTVGKLLSHSTTNENVKTSSGSASGMPRCGNCGKERVFEMQLTPHAIMELEREEDGIDGMEWGTIIVGVCDGDCVPSYVSRGEVGYAEEWVGVQWEEESVRR